MSEERYKKGMAGGLCQEASLRDEAGKSIDIKQSCALSNSLGWMEQHDRKTAG